MFEKYSTGQKVNDFRLNVLLAYRNKQTNKDIKIHVVREIILGSILFSPVFLSLILTGRGILWWNIHVDLR